MGRVAVFCGGTRQSGRYLAKTSLDRAFVGNLLGRAKTQRGASELWRGYFAASSNIRSLIGGTTRVVTAKRPSADTESPRPGGFEYSCRSFTAPACARNLSATGARGMSAR